MIFVRFIFIIWIWLTQKSTSRQRLVSIWSQYTSIVGNLLFDVDIVNLIIDSSSVSKNVGNCRFIPYSALKLLSFSEKRWPTFLTNQLATLNWTFTVSKSSFAVTKKKVLEIQGFQGCRRLVSLPRPWQVGQGWPRLKKAGRHFGLKATSMQNDNWHIFWVRVGSHFEECIRVPATWPSRQVSKFNNFGCLHHACHTVQLLDFKSHRLFPLSPILTLVLAFLLILPTVLWNVCSAPGT